MTTLKLVVATPLRQLTRSSSRTVQLRSINCPNSVHANVIVRPFHVEVAKNTFLAENC